MKARESGVGVYDAEADPEQLRSAFTGGDVPVAVYGLGKMGLPLAAVYGAVTGSVVGVDVDESVVEAVTAGDCPVQGEPGLAPLVADLVADGALTATTRSRAAADAARVHVVIVPTLLTDGNEPDLATVRAAVRSIGAGLDEGDLVVLESTVPPGTCRDVVAPALAEESGLSPGEFGVAFCPERTASGRALRDIGGAYPKVVGGLDDASTRAAALLYDELTEARVVPVADAATAEAVKVFEGVYRDVNVALANELARLADDVGIDVREAIEVANTQPYCDLHDPGPGVGGHCIPVYPYFLTDRAGESMDLLRTARAVNDETPAFVADRLLEALEAREVAPESASVLLLGATYRAGVAETRNAPARGLARRLDDAGVDVRITDPLLGRGDVDDWPATFHPVDVVPGGETAAVDGEGTAPDGGNAASDGADGVAGGADGTDGRTDRIDGRTDGVDGTGDGAAPSIGADAVAGDDGDAPGAVVPDVDAVVLATAHEAFDDWNWSAYEDVVVVDSRRAIDPASHDHPQYTVGSGFERVER